MRDDPSAEARYQQLQHLIASMPDLADVAYMRESEGLKWLGRASALVEQACDFGDRVEFNLSCDRLGSIYWNPTAIRTVLYRALARAEVMAPASARGAFIPTGAPFDVFAALSKVLTEARRKVLIVDPYLDATVLTDFGGLVPDGVTLHLLSDGQYVKLASQLKPAVERWLRQYGTTRPVEARQSPPDALHDRLVLIDDDAAWSLSQSIKDFAKRAPGSVSRLDAEIAARKMSAYAAIWSASVALA